MKRLLCFVLPALTTGFLPQAGAQTKVLKAIPQISNGDDMTPTPNR